MRRILVFQHVPYEPLGRLDPLLRAAGFRIRYVNFGREPTLRPRLDRYAGLIVLGGPMSATDTLQFPHLQTEVDLLAEAVERGLAVLGICLGAQLLARALGGTTEAAPEPEIGWHELELTEDGREDAVLAKLAAREQLFQWHRDRFSLPPGATLLARSRQAPAQAFRFGACAYGFQFHLEADEALIERWLQVPANRSDLELVAPHTGPERIRADNALHATRSAALADATFGKFIELAGWRGRKKTLPSR